MHPRAHGTSSAAHRSPTADPRDSEWGRDRVPRALQQEPEAQRLPEKLVSDLLQAGLAEDHARAEAARLLAGDIWGG